MSEQARRGARLGLAALLGALVPSVGSAAAAPAARAQAEEILQAAGVRGGLIVHAGCGDGRLTAALGARKGCVVQGLDTDSSAVARARAFARSGGVYGRVSIDQWDGRRLPYIDNLVKLLVAEAPGDLAMAEVMRVLAPRGAAYIKRSGRWARTVKPWPEDIDQWKHFLHDPGNNAVARDRRAGPPRHMQWLADPLWGRNHHKLASISSVVSADGRLFYIVDESTGASMAVDGTWSVTARDAFSGVLLWKRPIRKWAWHGHGFRFGPVQLPRTLVAEGGRVYVPLGVSAPVTALDAATGDIVRTYSQTDGAEEILVRNGVLYVVSGSPVSEQSLVGPRGRAAPRAPKTTKTVRAVGAETGKVLWEWSDSERGALLPLTLAAWADRVFFAEAGGVACLDARTGKQRWFAPAPYTKASGRKLTFGPHAGRVPDWMSPAGSTGPARTTGWSLGTLVVQDDVVLWAATHELKAFSARTGKLLWSCPCRPGYCRSPVDVLVVGKEVWLGPDFSAARDLKTGKVTKRNDVFWNLWTAGHHHRCYRNKATGRYIITSHRGVELMDLAGRNHSRNNWTRGVCQYGILPCNGLLYCPSHICACYIEAKLYGFWAFSTSADQGRPRRPASGPALDKGPAYRAPVEQGAAESGAWCTYRGNPSRSGCTEAEVPGDLREGWRAALGGALTQPVTAGGRLFAASVDAHTLFALDADSGKVLWSFLAGGRVDSPPTCHRGMLLLGCADGWVYCLRASDGALRWRFRAAPDDVRTVARDQVESLWPLHGNVLVQNGVAYVAAGRSSYLDGGIRLYGLDPATGKAVHQTAIVSAHPSYEQSLRDKQSKIKEHPFQRVSRQFALDWKTFTDPDRSDSFAMEGGAVTDVLVGDGSSVYMRQVAFDRSLVRRSTVGRHLFSTTRLINGAEHHRTHQVLGTGNFTRAIIPYSWIVNAKGATAAGQYLDAPHGLLLVFDEATAWAVHHDNRSRTPYTLFAERIRPLPPSETTRRDLQSAARRGKPGESRGQVRLWSVTLPFRPRALLRAGGRLFVAGMAGIQEGAGLLDAYQGRKGGVLWAVSAADGKKLAEWKLKSPPVWDGMAAAKGRLYVTTIDGQAVCLRGLRAREQARE